MNYVRKWNDGLESLEESSDYDSTQQRVSFSQNSYKSQDEIRLRTPSAKSDRPSEHIDLKFPVLSSKQVSSLSENHWFDTPSSSSSSHQRALSIHSNPSTSKHIFSNSLRDDSVEFSFLSTVSNELLKESGVSSLTMRQNSKTRNILDTWEDSFSGVKDRDKRDHSLRDREGWNSDSILSGALVQTKERSKREVSADSILEHKKKELDKLMKRTNNPEEDRSFLRSKPAHALLLDDHGSGHQARYYRSTVSNYSKGVKNRTGAAEKYRQKKGINQEIERKLNEYRTNVHKMAELEKRVESYKRERKPDTPKDSVNRIVKNVKELSSYHPQNQLKTIEKRGELLNQRLNEVKQKRMILEHTAKEETEIKIELRLEKRTIRDLQQIVSAFNDAWTTIITSVKMFNLFSDLFRELQIKKEEEAKRRKQEEAEREEKLRIEEEERKRMELINSQFKTRFRKQLRIISHVLVPAVMRWRTKRQKEKIHIIRAFLVDLNETFKIPLAMTRYKNAVTRIQTFYRQYRAMNNARILLIKLQIDEVINRKMGQIEKLIEVEKKKSGNSQGGFSSSKISLKSPGKSLTPKLSLRYLMNQRGTSEKLYELMAKKEELKKIDIQVRVKFIKQNMVERRRRYMEDMDRYERYVSFAKNKSSLGAKDVNVLPKPHFKLLLENESITKLVEQMRSHTRELIIQQRNENKTLTAKRGHLKQDFTDFFQANNDEFRKTTYIKRKNFDFTNESEVINSAV